MKVKLINRDTISVEVFTGKVKCGNCGTTNLFTASNVSPITIECDECGHEIGCIWKKK